MMSAFAGNAVLTLLLALVDYDTSDWLIAGNMFVRGLFFALHLRADAGRPFATISPEATGRASSIFSVTRQVAASLGVAILATALTTRLAPRCRPGPDRRRATRRCRLPGHVHLCRRDRDPWHPGRAVDRRQSGRSRVGIAASAGKRPTQRHEAPVHAMENFTD